MSALLRPTFSFGSSTLNAILNNNQLGIITMANSGERYNITSGTDLNLDGINTSDRPVGIGRNSGTTPVQFNVDLLYSRFFTIAERYRLEVFADIQNVFNINRIISYTTTTAPTNTITGELTGPVQTSGPVSQESRQAQVGIKFDF